MPQGGVATVRTTIEAVEPVSVESLIRQFWWVAVLLLLLILLIALVRRAL